MCVCVSVSVYVYSASLLVFVYFCADSGLGPFLQRLKSPSASGPVVLPASRVIRTGHADQ